MEETARPDPDALLERIAADDSKVRRGRLKIYLGYAPGVGKTYTMLAAAREVISSGVDLVTGFVETHGRFDTAGLLLGLELLPCRRVEHRERTLEEFDLEAALARKPAVLLLDELAHTNAPGGRHPKRWQDVFELLEAGIDVHTTLNVQHLESLNDVVAQITTIRVRETVPDVVLDRADEIALVDLSPEELLARLHDGKVYLPDQILQAAENFFRRGNLLALRELALRRAAERVDADVLAHRAEHAIRETWPTVERLLVCVGPGPSSSRIVRSARRMAAGLRAGWVAACVESPTAAPMSPAERSRLESHLDLAESLGSEVVHLSGSSVASTLLDYARRHNITRIIIGKPTHSRIRDLLRGSLLDEIVRGSGDIDVHVISGDAERPGPARRAVPVATARWQDYAWAAGLVAVASAAGLALKEIMALPDLAMLYLLVITIAAMRFGRGPSVVAATLSVASYDYFFVLPYYTFSVADTRHVLTFLVMFGVGILISELTLRLRRQEGDARRREERTAALYALSNELGSAVDYRHAAEVIARRASEAFRCGAALLAMDDGGDLSIAARAGEPTLGSEEMSVARWVAKHGRPAGGGTDTLPGARVTCVPLRAGSSALGVLALGVEAGRKATAEERHFVDLFARQGEMTLERALLAEMVKSAALRARTDEMRSSLLGAVSHDLRTPLAAITGAATTLRDAWPGVPDPLRLELLETICEDAERMERLVTNLLDMTRLESGAMSVRREWVPVVEMVGSALTRLEGKLAGREITTSLPSDLPLASVDPVLIEQVLVNLLENVAKYTPPATPVDVTASANGKLLRIEISDRGPGLPPGEETRIFEKFHRGPHVGIAGVGLGLSICRGIVEAHAGRMEAENRPGGGATFRLSLPLAEGAPVIADGAPAASRPGDAA